MVAVSLPVSGLDLHVECSYGQWDKGADVYWGASREGFLPPTRDTHRDALCWFFWWLDRAPGTTLPSTWECCRVGNRVEPRESGLEQDPSVSFLPASALLMSWKMFPNLKPLSCDSLTVRKSIRSEPLVCACVYTCARGCVCVCPWSPPIRSHGNKLQLNKDGLT